MGRRTIDGWAEGVLIYGLYMMRAVYLLTGVLAYLKKYINLAVFEAGL